MTNQTNPKNNGNEPPAPLPVIEVSSDEVRMVKRIKRRAVEIPLSDGQIALVFEPKTEYMGTFLRALPALQSISVAFKTSAQAAGGVVGMPVDIPDSVYEGLFPLIAIMSNMTVEDFKDLPLFDGMALMRGLTVFAPGNPRVGAPTTTN
jgi:hypothetical protein